VLRHLADRKKIMLVQGDDITLGDTAVRVWDTNVGDWRFG
jgi:hypothetical protein